MRSGSATAGISLPPARRVRCRGWTSGRSGMSPTLGSTSGPRRRTQGRRWRLRRGCTAISSTRLGPRCTRPATGMTASSSASSRPPAPPSRAPRVCSARWRRCDSCERSIAWMPTTGRYSGTQASQRGCPTTPAESSRFASQNPGLFKAPGFAIHPYSFTSLPPNVRIPNEPDYAELAALPDARVDARSPPAGLRLEQEVPDLVDRVRLHHQPAQRSVHDHPCARRVLPQLGRVHDLAGSADQVLRPVPHHGSAWDDGVRDWAEDRNRPAQADLGRVQNAALSAGDAHHRQAPAARLGRRAPRPRCRAPHPWAPAGEGAVQAEPPAGTSPRSRPCR